MEQILIKNISLPDWDFKEMDAEQFNSLSKSIRKNGQTKSIIVRLIEKDKYEVVDGKQVFKILKTLPQDYIWCHVVKNITNIESMLLYLEHDFYFQNNFVEISKAIEKIHKKITKLEISKFTKYSYSEISELLSLAQYDFSKFKEEQKTKQTNFF